MKSLIAGCSALVLSLGLAPGPLRGEILALDPVPAATLLLPYFEVDLDAAPADGLTTLFSIVNTSPDAQLARVTLWSDLGVPTFGFSIYLTGYDVATLNLRAVLEGSVPLSATLGQDPSDEISPQGSLSGDAAFPGCDGILPPPPVPPILVEHLQSAHTGLSSPIYAGLCLGLDHGDNVARGYATIDVMAACNLQAPGDPGYFVNGGTGEALNDNVLVGEFFYVDPANNFAQGEALVHLEADGLNPETAVAGEYTFYGSRVGWTASDNREPLASRWASRMLQFPGGGASQLVVWRDSKEPQSPFVCGTLPGPFPLNQEQIVVFDEQENPVVYVWPPFFPPVPPPTVIPYTWATQRVTVGGPSLPVPYSFGWLLNSLNTNVGNSRPDEDPDAAQSWVMAVHSAFGRFSVGYSAVQLDSAANADHSVLEPPP